MKLCILEPAYRAVSAEHYIQMMAIMSYFANKSKDVSIAIANISGVEIARNWLKNELWGSQMKFDYVLWIDSDQIFGVKNIERIIESAEKNNFDVISGKYYIRNKFPLEICAYNKIGDKYLALKDEEIDKEYMSVDAIGLGFCLMKARVLASITEKYGYKLFEVDDAKSFVNKKGEDVGFCEKLKNSGHQIWLDTQCHIKHEGFAL